MKRAITLARPTLAFPEAGWRERFEKAVGAAEKGDLSLEVSLARAAEPRALADLEKALGALPRDLRALLESSNGGRVGHLTLLAARAIQERTSPARTRWSGLDGHKALDGIGSSGLFIFGVDLEGNGWAIREHPADSGHSVVWLNESEPGVEHRFTTLGQFLESAFVRAHAAALHRQAENQAGDDLDDGPWLDAARRLETEIDPKMLRTRKD